MAGHSSEMIVWNLTDLSVLGIQLFGQASAESCKFRAALIVLFLGPKHDTLMAIIALCLKKWQSGGQTVSVHLTRCITW